MASIRIADPMLPALAAEFGGEPAAAASVITFFTIAYGAMQLVWGPLGDRLGKLRVVAWAALAAANMAPTALYIGVARAATNAAVVACL